jgi:hypothetical protein
MNKIVKGMMEESGDKEIVKKQARSGDEYKVDANKGNSYYLKMQEQQKKEAGDHSFGKSQSQQSQVDYSDVPFFMRQDRPKFSTVERYVPSSAASRALHFGMLGF